MNTMIYTYLTLFISFNCIFSAELALSQENKFIYKIRPETKEWAELGGFTEKLEVTEIPPDVARSMETQVLIASCLEHPFASLIGSSAYQDKSTGLNTLIRFNSGYKELVTRSDLYSELVRYFINLQVENKNKQLPLRIRMRSMSTINLLEQLYEKSQPEDLEQLIDYLEDYFLVRTDHDNFLGDNFFLIIWLKEKPSEAKSELNALYELILKKQPKPKVLQILNNTVTDESKYAKYLENQIEPLHDEDFYKALRKKIFLDSSITIESKILLIRELLNDLGVSEKATKLYSEILETNQFSSVTKVKFLKQIKTLFYLDSPHRNDMNQIITKLNYIQQILRRWKNTKFDKILIINTELVQHYLTNLVVEFEYEN